MHLLHWYLTDSHLPLIIVDLLIIIIMNYNAQRGGKNGKQNWLWSFQNSLFNAFYLSTIILFILLLSLLFIIHLSIYLPSI